MQATIPGEGSSRGAAGSVPGEASVTGDVVDFLKGLGPFATLSPPALRGIAKMARIRQYQPGERIIARGEPGDAMYIIFSGEVKIPILGPSGEEKMVAKLAQGQFFGEMSLMTGDPRAADVYAVGNVMTIVLPKDAFNTIVRETPSLARFLTQILAERLSEGGLMASKAIGKYQLLGELGRGGMSIVYNAVHTVLNRAVAVKMLNHQLAFDEKFRASFTEEARLIAQLEHENIIRVYDTEQAYATYFIMMEYVRGMALSKVIEAAGLMPPDQVRDVLVQMCRALGYAHSHGIVHRDVKPANAIVTPDGRVKLMDFGIALSKAQSAGSDEIVGTAEYMPPEQIQGLPVDRRADIYALGIMAYQMLTDELPFTSDNPYDILVAHVTKPVPHVKSKVPDAPDDLCEFVERATRKDPAERFTTLEEALRLLAPQAGGGGGFAAKEGQVVTIFYTPSEIGTVERAIAGLKQALSGNGNVRIGTSTIQAP